MFSKLPTVLLYSSIPFIFCPSNLSTLGISGYSFSNFHNYALTYTHPKGLGLSFNQSLFDTYSAHEGGINSTISLNPNLTIAPGLTLANHRHQALSRSTIDLNLATTFTQPKTQSLLYLDYDLHIPSYNSPPSTFIGSTLFSLEPRYFTKHPRSSRSLSLPKQLVFPAAESALPSLILRHTKEEFLAPDYPKYRQSHRTTTISCPMVRLLLFFILPLSSWAQVPQEELTLEAQELLDTSTINTISAHHLWQVLGLPKDLIYSFSEYRNAFGHLDHPDELYYISGMDSSTAHYLLDLLPIKRSTIKTSNQIISKARLSAAGPKSNHSLIHRSGGQSAALHITHESGSLDGSGFLAAQRNNTTLLLGQYSLHFGQGLLFGRDGFNSLTTSEYFRSGIKGQTGASSSGLLKGFAVQHILGKHTLTLAHDATFPLYAWTTTSSQIAYGIAGRGPTLSTFAKYSHGPLRLFGEANEQAQKIGAMCSSGTFFMNWLRT